MTLRDELKAALLRIVELERKVAELEKERQDGLEAHTRNIKRQIGLAR